jgi:DNA-binding NtrC family response regulator
MERSRILFVDDEPHLTAALKRALRQEPYEILTADSANAALEILAKQEIDVVISDERMPGMPGSVFLSQVRKKYPETVRIILSGQANLEDVVRAINEGEIYRFFIKPINAADLGTNIRQALQQKQLVKQSRRLLHAFKKQSAIIDRQISVIEELERTTPGITQLDTDADGAIVMNDDDGVTVDQLLDEIGQEIQQADDRIAPAAVPLAARRA